MARLALRCENRVLRDYPVGETATIGRLADNTVIIDDASVSSHHACIVRERDLLVLEDLQSTNGTFVNGVRVSRHVLQHGDVMQLGTHQLVLDRMAEAEPAVPESAELPTSTDGATMFVDRRTVLARLMQSETEARKYEALMARLKDIETHVTRTRATPLSEESQVAVLRVVDGTADRTEYSLQAQTSLIGKGKSSLVRLHGWFKPNVAVAITRNRQGYVATWLGGDVLINSHRVTRRHELKDHDLLDVSGLILEFRLEHDPQDSTPEAAAEHYEESRLAPEAMAGCYEESRT